MQIIGPPGRIVLPSVSTSSYRYSGRSALYGLGATAEPKAFPPKSYGVIVPEGVGMSRGGKSAVKIGRGPLMQSVFDAMHEAYKSKIRKPIFNWGPEDVTDAVNFRTNAWLKLIEAAYGARRVDTGIATVDALNRGQINALRDDIAKNAGQFLDTKRINSSARTGKDNFGKDINASSQASGIFKAMLAGSGLSDNQVKYLLVAVMLNQPASMPGLFTGAVSAERMQGFAAPIIWGAMQRFGVAQTQQLMDQVLAGQRIYVEEKPSTSSSATTTTKPPVDTSFATGTGVDSFVGGGQAAAETKPAQQMPGSGNVNNITGGATYGSSYGPGITGGAATQGESDMDRQKRVAAQKAAEDEERRKKDEERRKKEEAAIAAGKARAAKEEEARKKQEAYDAALRAEKEKTAEAEAAYRKAQEDAAAAAQKSAQMIAQLQAAVAAAIAAANAAAAATANAGGSIAPPPATAVTPTGDIVVADGGALAPAPAPASKSNTALIVGGVALAAVIGGVLWARSRRA